jgi:hypothetical protein
MTEVKRGGDNLEAAQRLVDVLTAENAALKRLDFPAAIALVPAKEAALAELTGVPAAPVRQPALVQRLAGLAAENQVLLERAISVQTRIVRIIARASAPSPAATRYNGHGGLTATNRAGALAVWTRA